MVRFILVTLYSNLDVLNFFFTVFVDWKIIKRQDTGTVIPNVPKTTCPFQFQAFVPLIYAVDAK